MHLNKELVIFGAGSGGIKIADCLNSAGFHICAFIDNDPSKWGIMLEGICIKSPKSLIQEFQDANIVIASIYHEEIQKQLNILGISEQRIKIAEELIYQQLTENPELWKPRYTPMFGARPYLCIEAAQGLGLGGIEQWTRTVAEELSRRSIEFCILTRQEELEHEIEAAGSWKGFDFNEKSYWNSILDLVTFLSSHLPCNIILNRVNQVFLAAHLVKQMVPEQVHLTYVMHNDFERFYRHCQLAADEIDTFICVSSRIQKKLKEEYHVKTPSVFLKSPVFLDNSFQREPKVDNTALKIGYAARIEKGQKRCELLLPLIERMEERRIDYRLEIAGDGSYLPKLKAQLEERNFLGHVSLLGRLDSQQMIDFWKRQEVSINISDMEGCALTMLESMSYGVVPVMTRVSGTEDFVEDGVNGFLRECGDINGIAEAVDRISKDSEFLTKAGRKCKEKIFNSCNVKTYVDSLLNLLSGN